MISVSTTEAVRGHDFLAYFKSHMTAFCLIFWSITISMTVTASAIILLKQIEGAPNKYYVDVTTTSAQSGSAGARGFSDYGAGGEEYHQAYANYDMLGFLIDALYAGDEVDSFNRSKQAKKAATEKLGRRTTRVYDYNYKNMKDKELGKELPSIKDKQLGKEPPTTEDDDRGIYDGVS